MSRRFLTNIDLSGNELVNGVIENHEEDPVSGKSGQIYYNTTENILKVHDGSSWQAVGSAEYIQDVISELLESGDGISLFYDDEEGSLLIANTGVLSVANTDTNIVVSASAGNVDLDLSSYIKIGKGETTGTLVINGDNELPVFAASTDGVFVDTTLNTSGSAYFNSDVEVRENLTVHGDLNVDGLLNAINRTEINLEDNTIRLNSNLSASATPVSDAGLIVERGAESNAALRWNESLDQWEIGFEGGSYEAIVASNDINEDIQDVVGGMVVGSNSLSVTYADSLDELQLDTVLQTASASYLLKDNGLAVDLPTLETQLITDSFTRKAAANVGNGTNSSFALVHGFNTKDVIVNVYDNLTSDTVEVDVVRTDADTVTVTFAEAPDASAYRVVIIG
jgi:hypothetical protein